MIDAQMLWRLRQRGSALSGLHPEHFATPELAAIAAEFATHYAAMAVLDEKIAELARPESPTSADRPIPNPAETFQEEQ